jgi:hypothetical protein
MYSSAKAAIEIFTDIVIDEEGGEEMIILKYYDRSSVSSNSISKGFQQRYSVGIL